MNKYGTVYWITGLAGAGKTSVGKNLYDKIKPIKPNILFLDGDELRNIMKVKNTYSVEERLSLAYRYSKLCKLLSDQNINVIIATISMFNEIRSWNKINIKNYKEIYIKVPIEVLIQRDQKKIYSNSLKKKMNNVMGLDIDFEEPQQPDVLCLNDGSKDIEQVSIDILNKLNLIDFG